MRRAPVSPRLREAYALPHRLVCALALLCALAGCSGPPDAPQANGTTDGPNPLAPTSAQRDAFVAQDPDVAIRQLARADYALHYALMRGTGIEQALGGKPQALAALQALGDQYERQARGLRADLPTLVPASLAGDGMNSGFAGLGIGGFVGMVGGGMVSSAVSGMSDEQLAELVKQGPIKLGDKGEAGNKFDLQFHEDGSVTQDTEFNGKVGDGLTGKIKMKVKMDACPDPEGKLTLNLTIDSTMAVDGQPGVGGSVHSEFRYERYLNDDAQLMPDDGTGAHMYLDAGGHGGGAKQSFQVTMGYGRGGSNPINDVDGQGYSIFRMDEVRAAGDLMRQTFVYQQLLAEMMLRGSGKGGAWESGRCVTLKPTASPGKRKGARPNTAYDIEAAPRAKSDGAPTGGTVRATLDGASRLQPQGKVQADATFAYGNPEKKDESATITFEARSKRGVGRATLEFDTKRTQAYLAEGGLDDFHGVGVICDLSQTFTISGGGNTVTFTPTGDKSGTYTYAGNMGGVGVSGNGTWSAVADENGGTLKGTGNGCVRTPFGTRCGSGTEVYTLKPMAACPEGQ